VTSDQRYRNSRLVDAPMGDDRAQTVEARESRVIPLRP
jgi:hypothetical protein